MLYAEHVSWEFGVVTVLFAMVSEIFCSESIIIMHSCPAIYRKYFVVEQLCIMMIDGENQHFLHSAVIVSSAFKSKTKTFLCESLN